MNALEFNATTHDGVITIPGQYLRQWDHKRVRVILLEADEDDLQNQATPAVIAEVPEDAPLPRKAGALKGRISITSDFNEPLEDFAEYEQ